MMDVLRVDTCGSPKATQLNTIEKVEKLHQAESVKEAEQLNSATPVDQVLEVSEVSEVFQSDQQTPSLSNNAATLTNPCYIERLPNETLAEIFSYLPMKETSNGVVATKNSSSISLVCKHWQKFYEKEMFRVVHLDSKAEENISQCQVLMEKKSYLYGYVDYFVFQDNKTGSMSGAYSKVEDIIKKCGMMRKLRLDIGDCSNLSNSFYSALGRSSMLEELHIGLVALKSLIGCFDMPSLKRLVYFVSVPDPSFSLPRERQFTASFTSLVLEDPEGSIHYHAASANPDSP